MMNEKEILRYYEASLSEAQDGIKSLRGIWKNNQAKYMCEKDFSKKQEWQSRIVTPIAKPKVKRAVNLVKMTLLRYGEYFDFDTPANISPENSIRCNYTKLLVKAHLNARPCSFVDNLCESLEAAFGWSAVMILKFWVGYVKTGHFDMPHNEYVNRESLVLRCKSIDPFLFDFTPDRKIQIEHQFVTIPEIWSAVEAGDFDKKTVNKMLEGDYGDPKNRKEEDKARLQRLNLDESKNEYRKEVKLSHFWGPLIDKKGKVQKDHCRFTIANDKFMLTEVEDNPYPDKSTPYVFDSIIKVPFRHIGKALCEDVNPIEDGICDLANMQWDNALWQSLGVTELDQMSMTNQDKSQMGNLYPGVPIIRRPGSPELAFKRHEMGTDPTRVMPFLQELKGFHDSDHGVTEAISANIPEGNFADAGDMGKRIDALGQFEGFATDLERGMFTRCIDKARDLILQYLSDSNSDPNAERILGEMGVELEQLTDEQKAQMIVDEYAIVPRGISIFFDRMRKANAYTGIYKNVNALPEAGQEWINFEEFVPRIFESTAIDDPKKFILTSDQVKQNREQKQQQMQQQQQQMMQLEMQKLQAPLQTKLQQTQMGIQERMSNLDKTLQAKMQEVMAKMQVKGQELQVKSKDSEAKMMMDMLKIMIDAAKSGEDRDVNLIGIMQKARNELQRRTETANPNRNRKSGKGSSKQ